MTAQLWIDGPMPSLNDLIDAAKGAGGTGKHYFTLKAAWTDTVWAQALQARLPKFPGRVVMHYEWIEKDKRRDPDNVAAGGKKCINDGLVKAGVLKGDGWKFLDVWTDRFTTVSAKPLCKGPGCLVTIESAAGTVLMGANT